MAKTPRERQIGEWLDRIGRSPLSPRQYLASHRVPFSLAQFYRYRAVYEREGVEGLADARARGNHRRIHIEAEDLLRWYVSTHEGLTGRDLREALKGSFGIEVTPRGLNKCLRRLGIHMERPKREEAITKRADPNAGFQLVLALAWHFGWPQATASMIAKAITQGKASKRFARPQDDRDHRGRNRRGQFTSRYNQRFDVRKGRFASIEQKRKSKHLDSMDILWARSEVLQRKSLAVLSLPFVTNNGEIRTVNKARGKILSTICGFRYKQATLTRFLSELKALGASAVLLPSLVDFWREHWRGEISTERNLPLLCYYIDGNTKALWSKKRVKKTKVTMLGRIMGSLEQVFVHDSYGRPVYLETFAGHAPLGEYILSLFEKIEHSLEGPGPRLPVNRAIVMDGASNSVRTLRAFAAQRKYHYITTLDDNQWSPRKVRMEGRPQRYRHGPATLRDCEIELTDSQEPGYLFVTRGIKIEWDEGKKTYLTTSLPKDIIGPSLVVKSYFDRWPCEELPFRRMKAVACLHRVAGYGKQEAPDERVLQRQKELAAEIGQLKKKLSAAITAIEEQERQIAPLIVKERRLRARSRIVDGNRLLPKREAEELQSISRAIARHERIIRDIRNAEPDLKKLETAECTWLRLQGKEKVYKADVELDQIMTYFRVSLVNLYAYLSQLMGGSHLSLMDLLHAVLFLSGTVQESSDTRHVILESNDADPEAMERLRKAIRIINGMEIRDGKGRRYSFVLE